MKRLLILSLALFATACARETSSVLQGYGEADYIYLASQETGVVSELNVREGDVVETGAQIFSLDPDRLAFNEASARARRRRRGGYSNGASTGNIGAAQLSARRRII